MDHVKEAFQKVKQDILFLKQELEDLKSDISGIKQLLEKNTSKYSNSEQRSTSDTSTDRHINSTNPTHTSTHNSPLEAVKGSNMPISTGNQGVSTDRQTDRQTDQHTQNNENSIDDAAKILDSLDNIKKEIRIKFKAITEQEFLVFSTIYQIDEELGYSDYKLLSERLNLTESSIRDYVGRLIKKGIPVEKKKINNKNIRLSIAKNLKKIATLPTILKLRDL